MLLDIIRDVAIGLLVIFMVLPEVRGLDDARRAEWVAAGSFGMLTAELACRFGGEVFAAHVPMLEEFLG